MPNDGSVRPLSFLDISTNLLWTTLVTSKLTTFPFNSVRVVSTPHLFTCRTGTKRRFETPLLVTATAQSKATSQDRPSPVLN